MRLLIIVSNHIFHKECCDNIKLLNDYMKNTGIEFDYCGISNQNDFDVYETIIQFKYKIINNKKQLSKICDFITEYKSQLDYDWYMKIRPEIKLLDNIAFHTLSESAINARARVYNGPKKIQYGMSINGAGIHKNIGDCNYADRERNIIIDDMIYIFHKNILNAFEKIQPSKIKEDEWERTRVFHLRKIKFNVIGIHLCFTKFGGCFSGNINM